MLGCWKEGGETITAGQAKITKEAEARVRGVGFNRGTAGAIDGF